MRKRILLALSLMFAVGVKAQQDPVLMEIDGKPVTKSEFLQIYLKNNPSPQYDKVSLDEYMELFKKFKLKVAEAETLGYDTIPKLKRELDGYKKQLALPYLTDSEMNEELVKEAYERTKSEVRASHILIKLPANPTPEDTLKAYNKALEAKKRLEKGEDFAAVARQYSEDPSVSMNGGDLGYFTAFQMVYPFEDAAYKTPIGGISNPVRTRFGYHIIKVTDKRPARGTIKTAHIMVATPKNATPEDIASAEKKINEIYEKLQKGEKFEDLAREYSDDPSSSQKGGELPMFGTGTTTRMVAEFEDAAFKLKNNGDYSEPIRTAYGFHIIKRLEWDDVRSYDDMKKELQNKVNRDERSKKTQDSFVAKLKKEYNFKDVSSKNLKWFDKNIDTNYYNGKWNADALKSDKALFVLDGKNFTQKEFATFLKSNYRGAKKEDISSMVRDQYAKWQKEAILNYEESKLPQKYPEYKALVNEYHDGILLYEIMSDKVWNKAIKDTTGMKEFFQANRANYMWENRLDAVVYECANEKIANQVYKMIQNDTINSKHVIDVVNKDSELNLRVKTNKFETANTPYLKDQNLVKGVNKPYLFEGKYYVIKVNEVLQPQEKELNDAKGAITSDYQNYLEKTWLEELAKKHSVKVNESVLYSIGK